MNIFAPPVEIHKSLSPPSQLIIDLVIQQKRISPLTSSLFKGQNKVSLIINILQIFNGDLG